MANIDIPVRPFFYPLSMLPPFDIKENREKNTNSYDISDRGVNLPGSSRLTDDDMKFICDGIKKVLL
jgi:perosamine synthetase